MSQPVREPLSELLVELARRHQPGLDREEQQNLASEAVLRGQSQPPPDGQLRPWIYRIYQHLVVDRLRRLSVERKLAQQTVYGVCWQDPEQMLADAQLRAEVQEAIASLPPRFQKPVQLRFIEGQPCDDIARALGLPSVTVRTRIHRGVLVLRRKLAALRMVILGPVTSASAPLTAMALVLALGPTFPETPTPTAQPSHTLPVRHEIAPPTLATAPAIAQPVVPEAANPRKMTASPPIANEAPTPVTSYEFDEDEVDGTGLHPDIDIITADTPAPQASLIEIPASMLEPLIKSLEDL